MSDCRLTTFDNPYDPFEQFALWMLFDNQNGYNTCGNRARPLRPGTARPPDVPSRSGGLRFHRCS